MKFSATKPAFFVAEPRKKQLSATKTRVSVAEIASGAVAELVLVLFSGDFFGRNLLTVHLMPGVGDVSHHKRD